MLSKRLFRFINKIALFAIVFASLAPTISHAFSSNNSSSFTQEICSSSGQKLFVQVVTTQGQQRLAELDIKSPGDNSPQSINHHLEHCPFCSNASNHVAIIVPHAPILVKLAEEAQLIAANSPVVLRTFSVVPPPSQAPPAL